MCVCVVGVTGYLGGVLGKVCVCGVGVTGYLGGGLGKVCVGGWGSRARRTRAG